MVKTFPPDRRKVGDLCKQKFYGQYLIIGIVIGIYNAYDIITEHGQQFQIETPEGYEHNTGLHYTFESPQKVTEDYKNGLFTPYFEIL